MCPKIFPCKWKRSPVNELVLEYIIDEYAKDHEEFTQTIGFVFKNNFIYFISIALWL